MESEENIKTVKSRAKTKWSYSKEAVALALEQLRHGKKNAEVSRKYGIPEYTLRAKRLGIYADKKPGPSTVFNADEEKEIVNWINHCCDKGFPVTKSQLVESVRKICVQMKKKNPFTDNTPGRAWYEGFLNRHPEISSRVSEKVSLNRAKVTEYSLRQWFKDVLKHHVENNLTTLEPNRIFNSDESGLSLNPISSSVLAPKGQKNVFTVVNNIEKENITTLVTASAAGDLAPTFVLFTGNSLPSNVAQLAPVDFAFGFSKTGWMLSENYYEYIANVFEPYLTEKNIKRPVIMYIDSHASHVTLHLSKFCAEKQIVLIALHPNATHIMQPLDVSLFRTLKANWKTKVETFCRDTFAVGIQKSQFAPLLKQTLDSMNLKTVLQNGFKKSGLYPFDVDAIDFSKVIKRIEDSDSLTVDSSQVSLCNCQTVQDNSLEVFEKFLRPEKIETFRLNESPIWRGNGKDEELFNVWYKLSNPSSDSLNILKNEKNDSRLDFSMESVTAPDLTEIIDNTHGQQILNGLEVESMMNSDDSKAESQSSIVVKNDCILMEFEVDVDQNIPSDSISNDIVFASNDSRKSDSTSNGIISTSNDSRESDSTSNGIISTSNDSRESDSTSNGIISTSNDSRESNSASNGIISTSNDSRESDSISNVLASNDSPALDTSLSSTKNTSSIDPLCEITNFHDKKSPQSEKSLQKFLFWPSNDLLQNKNKKRTKGKVHHPSVITGTQWQQIIEMKENEKKIKIEEVETKKKARLEKEVKIKLEKEALKKKREEKKLQKQRENFEKEKNKLLKQQQKFAAIAEKRQDLGKKVARETERVEIEKQIQNLQERQIILNQNL